VGIDPETWGIEHWSLAIAIASLLATLVLPLIQLLLQLRQDSERHLAEDPILRAEWAAQLRSSSAGTAYRNALARALAWLDRVFGPPGSIRALGVCVLVALAYAWVTFFLGWGFFGGSGGIAGLPLLSNAATQPARGLFAALALGLPFIMFIVTRWLARSCGRGDEWVEGRILRYLTPWLGHRGTRTAYWLMRTILVGGLVGVILLTAAFPMFYKNDGFDPAGMLISITLYFLMPYFGARIACAVDRHFGDSLASNMAAFIASVGAPLLALLIITLAMILSASFFILGAVVLQLINDGDVPALDGWEFLFSAFIAFFTIFVITVKRPFAAGYTVPFVFCIAVASLAFSLARVLHGDEVSSSSFPGTVVAVSAFFGGLGTASVLVRRGGGQTHWSGALGTIAGYTATPLIATFFFPSMSGLGNYKSAETIVFILFFSFFHSSTAYSTGCPGGPPEHWVGGCWPCWTRPGASGRG